MEIEELIEMDIDLHHPNLECVEEIIINNIFDSEIECVIVDKYLPLRLKNNYSNNSYTISIPIKRFYLTKNDELIESPINDNIITWEDFLAIPNMNENIY